VKPKIFYFGNAVNFDSPVLHGLEMFNILENHPINEARIYKNKFNIMLEINRNENANKKRNTRAFGSGDDAMTTAQFETNDYNIANESDRENIKRNPRFIYIKLKSDYLKIWFNRDSLHVILSIESNINYPYHYNMQLKDNKEQSIYLKESYFDEKHIKKIDKGYYLFENNIIREILKNDDLDKDLESKEKQFKENYIEQTKKGLMKKIWG